MANRTIGVHTGTTWVPLGQSDWSRLEALGAPDLPAGYPSSHLPLEGQPTPVFPPSCGIAGVDPTEPGRAQARRAQASPAQVTTAPVCACACSKSHATKNCASPTLCCSHTTVKRKKSPYSPPACGRTPGGIPGLGGFPGGGFSLGYPPLVNPQIPPKSPF